MAHVQFSDVQERPTAFLDLTSLTRDALQPLVPPIAAAFQAHMAAWRLDGRPRTARPCAVDKNCPLPTPEDRLLFLLAYVKTYALHVVQGRVCGMGQSKAHPWLHVLLPVRRTARRPLGDAPARSLSAMTQRLGVSEADAAPVVAPLEEEPTAVGGAPTATPASPLWPMTGPNGASSAPKTLRNRRSVRVARTRTIRSNMSCSSMPCSSSFSSVTPMAAAPMISPWPTQRRIPCPQGAASDRLWASSR